MTSGTKTALSLERIKLSPAILRKIVWLGDNKQIQLSPHYENGIIAPMIDGVICPGLTSARNVVGNLSNTSLSAGSVEYWPATGAGGIDCERVVHILMHEKRKAGWRERDMAKYSESSM